MGKWCLPVTVVVKFIWGKKKCENKYRLCIRKCPECGCEFKASRGLKYHTESVHKDENVEIEAIKTREVFLVMHCVGKGFRI